MDAAACTVGLCLVINRLKKREEFPEHCWKGGPGM